MGTHTTAQMVMRIGRPDGAWERRRGVVRSMERDALARLVVPPHPSPTIVWQDTPTGWQAGVLAKKLGAARTKGKAVLLQLEAVLENTSKGLDSKKQVTGVTRAGTHVPSSGVVFLDAPDRCVVTVPTK